MWVLVRFSVLLGHGCPPPSPPLCCGLPVTGVTGTPASAGQPGHCCKTIMTEPDHSESPPPPPSLRIECLLMQCTADVLSLTGNPLGRGPPFPHQMWCRAPLEEDATGVVAQPPRSRRRTAICRNPPTLNFCESNTKGPKFDGNNTGGVFIKGKVGHGSKRCML